MSMGEHAKAVKKTAPLLGSGKGVKNMPVKICRQYFYELLFRLLKTSKSAYCLFFIRPKMQGMRSFSMPFNLSA
jgi:hypothetical protein